MSIKVAVEPGTEKRARGRNGWFVPALVQVAAFGEECSIPEWRRTLEFAVSSKRGNDTSPILFTLGVDEALALALEIESEVMSLRAKVKVA